MAIAEFLLVSWTNMDKLWFPESFVIRVALHGNQKYLAHIGTRFSFWKCIDPWKCHVRCPEGTYHLNNIAMQLELRHELHGQPGPWMRRS